MNAQDAAEAMTELQAAWRYQAIGDSERRQWVRLLALVDRSDFEVALDQAQAQGALRRPMVGEFGAAIRAAAAVRVRGTVNAERRAEPMDHVDPEKVREWVMKCKQMLNRRSEEANA